MITVPLLLQTTIQKAMTFFVKYVFSNNILRENAPAFTPKYLVQRSTSSSPPSYFI